MADEGGPIKDSANADLPSVEQVARLDAYLGEWHDFGTPERLRAAWDAAELFTALHHAASYASISFNHSSSVNTVAVTR